MTGQYAEPDEVQKQKCSDNSNLEIESALYNIEYNHLYSDIIIDVLFMLL